ncbi:hypothetical protein GR138_12705 [Shinella kummerowiae]|uniref:Uncharacterized protein n=1 Tax=Shinella kummerowiae TaxID=417745 RepID=A0A6N8SBJ5_9HYPH|nr:hypothetical protein [Shinella kummerowiae]MXN46051.1 hypothetical protein [Shinella kummerowiae]
MRLLFFAALLAASASIAAAQQVMDGSGTPYGDSVASDIAASLIGLANDPYSAQIAKLRASSGSDDVICGLVNLKSPSGGYTGFQPFYFNLKTKSIDLRQSSGC